jgi:hypothetical protein
MNSFTDFKELPLCPPEPSDHWRLFECTCGSEVEGDITDLIFCDETATVVCGECQVTVNFQTLEKFAPGQNCTTEVICLAFYEFLQKTRKRHLCPQLIPPGEYRKSLVNLFLEEHKRELP